MSDRIIRFPLNARNGAANLAERLAHVGTALPDGIAVSHGRRDLRASAAGTEHGKALGEPPLLFDAYIEFRETGEGSFDRLERIAEEAASEIAPYALPDSSSVIVGYRHVLMSRPGPFMMIFALVRPDGMSGEDFIDYWRNRHGAMVVQANRGKGSYYQLHGDQAASHRLAERLSFCGPAFSGHAGGWMRDPALLGTTLSYPASIEALEDERRFIDHPRSSMGVYEVARDTAPIARPA